MKMLLGSHRHSSSTSIIGCGAPVGIEWKNDLMECCSGLLFPVSVISSSSERSILSLLTFGSLKAAFISSGRMGFEPVIMSLDPDRMSRSTGFERRFGAAGVQF